MLKVKPKTELEAEETKEKTIIKKINSERRVTYVTNTATKQIYIYYLHIQYIHLFIFK